MGSRNFEDLAVGEEAVLQVEFSSEKVAEFVALTGDDAAFHTNAVTAKQYGFQGCIAHGLLVQSPLSTLLGTVLPGQTTVINTITSKFHEPTYVGERVDYRLRITRLTPAVKAVLLEFEACVGTRKVVSGTAMCSFVTPHEA